jgi:hypothetical protein
MVHIRLNSCVIKPTSNQTLRVKHRMFSIRGGHVLCGIAHEALLIRETHVRRRRAVSLVVCDNLYTIILPNAHARKRSAKVNSYGDIFGHSLLYIYK